MNVTFVSCIYVPGHLRLSRTRSRFRSCWLSVCVMLAAHCSARTRFRSFGQSRSKPVYSKATTASTAELPFLASRARARTRSASSASSAAVFSPWNSCSTALPSSFVAQARLSSCVTCFWSESDAVWSGAQEFLRFSVFPPADELLEPLDFLRALCLALVLLVRSDGAGRVDYL